MGVLNQATRQELLDLLARVPGVNSRQGRDALLRDLPADLVQGIERSEATTVDLDHIVYATDNWWPTAGPVADYPLRQLVLTAMDLAVGSEVAPALQAFLARLPPILDPSARPRCPYPGMVPFAPEDARFFYGRETEIAEMLRRLRVGRYLLVIGPSGSGKSSLVTAGLLPALARQHPGTWHVVTLRPGATPGASLAQALDGDPAQPAVAVQALLAANAPATRLLVIVDQFEELFTQAERTAQSAFLTALTALRAVPAATLVLLMRADFYPDLMQSVLWPPGEGEQLQIAPLRGPALRAAITRPAADVGVEVDPALAERLVADAADEPGSLPLLQEALVLLWEQLRGRALPLADYLALGQGDRSGLAVALATRADATYNALTAAQQGVARRILLRLVAFGDGRPDTRRQQAVADLQVPGEDLTLFTGTLAALTDHRLVTTSGDGQGAGGRQVDLGHEALIRAWPLLQRWIAQRRGAEQARRRLEDKTAEWVRLGRADGGLLDAAELPEAERWLSSDDAAELGASADLRALVAASQETLKKARQAQAAASRQLRLIAVGLAGALLLAVIAAGIAGLQTQAATTAQGVAVAGQARVAAQATVGETQRQQAVSAQQTAQAQSRTSRAQALAANAVAQSDRDPELSLLLAMEAVSMTRAVGEPVVPQAEDALHLTLLRPFVRVTLRSHTGPVTNVAFSPNGRTVVTAGADGTAKLWDATTGQERLTLRGHTAGVTSAAFSPDGRTIVTASADGTAKLWDTTTGQERATLRGHTDSVTSTAFSLDGATIVTASLDGTAKLWDAITGQKRATLGGYIDGLTSVAFSPDGRSVVTASDRGTAKLWDVTTGEERTTFGQESAPLHGVWDRVTSVAFSPNGRTVVTAADDGMAKLWDTTTGQERATLRGHTDAVTSAAFSPDGATIVTASADGTAKLWDATSGQERTTLRGHTAGVTSAAFSPDGRTVVTASTDGDAKLWEATIGQEHITLRGNTGPIMSTAFSPDGRSVVTASSWAAQLWYAATAQERVAFQGHTAEVISVAFSPDGSTILTASSDGTAKIWNVSTGEERTTLRGHMDGVNSAAFSPDGHSIVTASSDGTAKLWKASTGEERTTLPVHSGPVWSAAFSPSGDTLITTSTDGTAKVWDAATGQERVTLRGHTSVVTSAAFSPTGRLIATASWDRTVKLWDVATGQERATLRGHTDRVSSVAFSPDGHLIVTASWDHTAKLWDAASGAERATLRGHEARVFSAAFSPDGHTVVTASDDGSARQYLVQIDDLMALAYSRVTRTLTPEERATYLGEPLPTPTPLATSPALDVTSTLSSFVPVAGYDHPTIR